MIFSVIVLCTIDRAIIWICANTSVIWPRCFISHFVSSHMLLLSRLSCQDLRVNSPKMTYCTSRSKLIFWDWSPLLHRDSLLHSFLLCDRRYVWQPAHSCIGLFIGTCSVGSPASLSPGQLFSFAPFQSLAPECRFAPCLPSKSFDDIFKVHIF